MARLKLTRKSSLIIGALLIVFIIASGVMVLMGLQASYNWQEEQATPVSIEDVQVVASKYANTNDIDGGLKYYDEQIKQRENEDDKKKLLLSKSNFALDAERLDEAMDAAKRANDISPDIASAEALARTYAAAGDKEQAIIYYKKVLDLASREGASGRYIPVWEEKIAELEQ